ncbi:hypothetical protein CesoFtcFv8_027133 [Champsocephalus esox]|uniref:Uncharacterized protein n=1 Tax=Champsocephalus esox TaxID=159716 RepID=A0AAN8B145_9TELE|nr:hypothetical protein CesoFtcFv8_027133 [Champsocephalus esox]
MWGRYASILYSDTTALQLPQRRETGSERYRAKKKKKERDGGTQRLITMATRQDQCLAWKVSVSDEAVPAK